MNRPSLAYLIDVDPKFSPRGHVLLQHRIKKTPVGVWLYERQHGSERLADISAQTQVQLRPAAQSLRPDVDLSDLWVGRHERFVGKIGAEQDEHIAAVHRLVSGAPAQESRHAHGVRIVVFDPFLAAKAVADGRFHLFGDGHHLIMGAGTPGAAIEGHSFPLVDEIGQARQVPIAGTNLGTHGHGCLRQSVGGLVQGCHVPRQDDHGNTPLAHRVLHRALEHARRLMGV